MNRRKFLGAAAMVAARAAIPGRLSAAPRWAGHIGRADAASSANALLPATLDASTLRTLAAAALDAARAAGATYADVRVAELHELEIRQRFGEPLVPDVDLIVTFTYGVRVLVNGAWAFAHGSAPDAASVAASARGAVATAKGNAAALKPSSQASPEWTAAPPVTGEWTSPVRIDPFGVAIEDQIAVLWAGEQAAQRTSGVEANGEVTWRRESRVIASTDGTMVTQTTCRGLPYFGASSDRGTGFVSLRLPLVSTSGGYETILVPTLQDQMKVAGEQVLRLASLPYRPMDVGRHPAVFDGFSMGSLSIATLGAALELDRVMGYEADASGTSFLAPVDEILGQQFFSPLLNVSAGRAVPAVNAVKWDDDGVEVHPYPVITGGRVVDYHTSRSTASTLRSWYERQHLPMASRGCAVAVTAADPVLIRTPHLTMEAGDSATTIDALCKEVGRGVLVHQADWGSLSMDQRCGSGALVGATMFEIERGQIVRRVADAGLQFATRGLWKSLVAVGGTNTVQTCDGWGMKGQPWIPVRQSATAPAVAFKDVDLIMTGRRS